LRAFAYFQHKVHLNQRFLNYQRQKSLKDIITKISLFISQLDYSVMHNFPQGCKARDLGFYLQQISKKRVM